MKKLLLIWMLALPCLASAAETAGSSQGHSVLDIPPRWEFPWSEFLFLSGLILALVAIVVYRRSRKSRTIPASDHSLWRRNLIAGGAMIVPVVGLLFLSGMSDSSGALLKVLAMRSVCIGVFILVAEALIWGGIRVLRNRANNRIPALRRALPYAAGAIVLIALPYWEAAMVRVPTPLEGLRMIHVSDIVPDSPDRPLH